LLISFNNAHDTLDVPRDTHVYGSECNVTRNDFCCVITVVCGGENNWHPVWLQWSGASSLSVARTGLGHGAGLETKPCRCCCWWWSFFLVLSSRGHSLLLSQRWVACWTELPNPMSPTFQKLLPPLEQKCSTVKTGCTKSDN